MLEFRLPSLGADMDEGKLVEWHVAPGDAVTKGQIVAEVETSKAVIDVESWLEGTVHQLLVEPGATVPVGALLATLLEPGEVAPGPSAEVPPTPAPVSVSEPTEVPSEISPAPGSPVPGSAAPTVPRSAGPVSPFPASTPAASAGAASKEAGARRRISPAARRRAAELGLDPTTVAGTGPDGAVTLTDVEQAAASTAASRATSAPVTPAPAPSTSIRASTPAARQAEMRKAIAAAMARSKREIPHYYLAETVPMRRATEWLTAANAERPITERMVGAVLQLKAVAVALADFPEFNGHYLDGQFRPSGNVHLGVAISLRKGGLIAPALHAVEMLALPDLMAAMLDLVRRARAGSLRSSEITDATITVSSLGDQGVETVFPIIYPPQVAIVGFGTVAPRPWVEDGALTVMPTVTASLAADHRASDGHRGALFLAAVRDLLQHPEDL